MEYVSPAEFELCTCLSMTAKGQVNIPKAVWDVLGLNPGDLVSWELEGDSVRLRFVPLVRASAAHVLARWSVLGIE